MTNRLEKGESIGSICHAWLGKETIHTIHDKFEKLQEVLRQKLSLL